MGGEGNCDRISPYSTSAIFQAWGAGSWLGYFQHLASTTSVNPNLSGFRHVDLNAVFWCFDAQNYPALFVVATDSCNLSSAILKSVTCLTEMHHFLHATTFKASAQSVTTLTGHR